MANDRASGNPSPAFLRARGQIRTALVARWLLDGATAGALLGAAITLALHFVGVKHALFGGVAALAAGLVGGAVLAHLRRLGDGDVALLLDARLGTAEAIATALEEPASPGSVSPETLAASDAALARATPAAIRPRVLFPRHALVVAGVAALVASPWLPVREGPTVAADPEKRATTLDGLHPVEELARIEAEDAEQKKRLEAMAAAAKRLEDRAKAGIEQKDALDALGRLREDVARENARLMDAKNRAGLEAAAHALGKHEATRPAGKALENGDLVALDRELEKLARSAEAEAREIAKQALEEASQAAEKRGASDVQRALSEQRRLLARRQAMSSAMRELSRLLPGASSEEVGRALQRLERGDAGAQEALARALAKALSGMSEAERRRVADAMRAAAQGTQDLEAASREDLERLARELEQPGAEQRLREALEQIAKGTESPGAGRARALALALRGVDDARRSLTGVAGEPGSAGEGEPGGPGPGGGEGNHSGSTAEVVGSSLPARASAAAAGGVPLGPVPGLAPAGPGVARVSGSEGLGRVAPGEISAVERSNVPREYRDQVGKYFAPE